MKELLTQSVLCSYSPFLLSSLGAWTHKKSWLLKRKSIDHLRSRNWNDVKDRRDLLKSFPDGGCCLISEQFLWGQDSVGTHMVTKYKKKLNAFIIVLLKAQNHHIITFSCNKQEVWGDWIQNTHENSGTTWTSDLKIQELSLFFNWLLHGWGETQPLIPAVWHLRELLCLLAMFLQGWQENWATLS